MEEEALAAVPPDLCAGWTVWFGMSYRGRREVRMCGINGRDAAAGTASRKKRDCPGQVYSEAPKRNA